MLWQVVLRWWWASHCFVLISMERDRGCCDILSACGLDWCSVSSTVGWTPYDCALTFASWGRWQVIWRPQGLWNHTICCPQTTSSTNHIHLEMGAVYPWTLHVHTHTDTHTKQQQRIKPHVVYTQAQMHMQTCSKHSHTYLHTHTQCKICLDTRPTPPSSSHTLITCIITTHPQTTKSQGVANW